MRIRDSVSPEENDAALWMARREDRIIRWGFCFGTLAMPHPTHLRICAAIEAHGWAAEAAFLPEQAIAALRAEARRRDAAGEFHAAGVGRGPARVERSDIRGDRIIWLDEHARSSAEVPLWQALAALQAALNRALFLGLDSFEGHYALYPSGAFYRRHRDRFRDDDTRVISCALYLNEDWSADDGGALRLHMPEGLRDVVPEGGVLACFLADRFEHEVLPAARERLAVSGWFRRRA
jgi:SM-20-related protein